MQELPKQTLVVFVSDSHIGGDPGCDGFECPEKLQALLQELSEHQGPVELVLAGDFFDFLQISPPSSVTDRAELTINHPEYQEMFEALRGFAAGEQHRVVYMPGNHDAETWWNPQVQNTLRESGLVDEFALCYLASLGTDEKRFTIYCEHGNQFDPPNYIEDYTEPLDTPLGHHIVTDFARRIAPIGEISPGLNLSDIKNVYPVTDIPQWVASKYFYHALGRAVSYVVIPLILGYIAYRLVTLYLNISAENQSLSLSQSYLALPRVHEAFLDTSFFILGLLVLLVIFFLFLRHRVRKLLSAGFAQGSAEQGRATKPQEVEALVKDNGPFPMLEDTPAIDVFVSGHTHKPGLKELERTDGSKAVMVNSGCWLRQLRPVGSHLRWPPVFASEFVLTHVRIFLRGSKLHVELWEHPKLATNPLTRTENLAAWGKMPDQPAPHAEPSVIAASEVTTPD